MIYLISFLIAFIAAHLVICIVATLEGINPKDLLISMYSTLFRTIKESSQLRNYRKKEIAKLIEYYKSGEK